MRKILQIIFLLSILVSITSCQWVSTTELKSLQPDIDATFFGQRANVILEYLGQPTSVTRDTIENIPITILHFEDEVTLYQYAANSKEYMAEPPYIAVYMKDGKAYSTKTNLVEPILKRDEIKLSIIKLATYAGVGFLALIITCIILLISRKQLFQKYENALEYYRVGLKDCKAELKQQHDQISNLTKNQYELRKSIQRAKKEEPETPKYQEPKAGQEFNELSEEEKLKLLNSKIEILGLDAKIAHCLFAADIKTIGQLCTYSNNKLVKIRNFGNHSLRELTRKLAKNGLVLGMNLTEYGFEPPKEN